MILLKILVVVVGLVAMAVTLGAGWRRTSSPWVGAVVLGLLVILWGAAYFAATSAGAP